MALTYLNCSWLYCFTLVTVLQHLHSMSLSSRRSGHPTPTAPPVFMHELSEHEKLTDISDAHFGQWWHSSGVQGENARKEGKKCFTVPQGRYSLYATQGTKACPNKAARISPSGNGINPMESSICSTLSSPRRVGVVSGQTGYSFILFQNQETRWVT